MKETNKMKEEYKEFVGIYDESVPVELCEEFVENYEEAKKNETIIDVLEENELGVFKDASLITRKDEAMFITPLYSTIYPRPPVDTYFKHLAQCCKSYMKKYGVAFNGPLYNDIFKIHKVRKSEGYHMWHYERGDPPSLDRIMAYMTYLEVPKKGGETEFLHQSLRIEPVVGRTLIWPAGFTHMHRGNPPLEGKKMYITGWFEGGRTNPKDGVGK